MQYLPETGSLINFLGRESFLEIIEQPQSKGFRFRYACEGKSHGGIQGTSSRKDKKTFPTIRLRNYCGPVKIVVSLVTDEEFPKPHAHELVGRNCENGVCTVVVNGEEPTVSFPNIGIKHITKKNVIFVLQERLRESYKLRRLGNMSGQAIEDVNNITISDEEDSALRRQAEELSKHMQLSVVKLQFQGCFLDERGNTIGFLPPVYSCPIYDSKAPCASLLKICRMDRVGGCCTGNEEVFLLCDKVQKEDIAVRFYEQDEFGEIRWEEFGQFGLQDVHRQYAIVFRTPPYHSTNITISASVHVQLLRLSDGEVSDPKTFIYYPRRTDVNGIDNKRKKRFQFGHECSPSDMQGNESGFSNKNMLSAFPRMADEYNQMNFRDPHSFIPTQSGQEGSFNVSCVGGANHFSSTLIGRGNMKTPNSTERDKGQDPNHVIKENSDRETEKEGYRKIVNQHRLLNAREICWKEKLEHLSECLQLYSCTEDARFLISPLKSLIKMKNKDGDNPIHLSIIHNKAMAAFNLLSVLNSCSMRHAVLNDLNILQQTPIFLAVLTNELVHLKMLLECDCGVSHVTRDGDTLLHVAAKLNRHECMDLFLRHRLDQLKPMLNQFNYSGCTAVHVAAKLGNLKCLKLLVTYGAEIQLKDQLSGRNALHHAIIGGHVCTTAYLILETSIDVNATTMSGMTALQMALGSDQPKIVDLLILANAEMGKIDESSESSDNSSLEADNFHESLEDCFSRCSVSDKANLNVPYQFVHEPQTTLQGAGLNAFDSGIESLRKDDDLQETSIR